MARISTFAASQTALMDLMKAQRSVFETQKELITGKKATDLKGVGQEAETLSATRAALARSKAYEQAGIRAQARLEAQDTALNHLNDAATDLRMALTTKDGNYMMHEVREIFNSVVNTLNTRHSGAFIFGGTRSDIAPVNVASLNDLLPMASAAEAFENNLRRPAAQLDQQISVDIGMLADEVAGPLMDAFKRIVDFENSASGPFVQPMTDAQQTFVTAEVGNVIAAIDNIINKTGEAGSSQAHVETLITSHKDRQGFLERFIGDMEDVDMADAATRFQQAQTALDVSARTFSSLSQVSLLNFLR
jgi:flagellar hook-associated protein 3 FlgL